LSKKSAIQAAVLQARYDLNADNPDRELGGMVEALAFFKKDDNIT
jgi:hypothetical protein